MGGIVNTVAKAVGLSPSGGGTNITYQQTEDEAPTEDSDAVQKSRQRATQQMQNSSGRQSTILTGSRNGRGLGG